MDRYHLEMLQRSSKRLSCTLPCSVYEGLLELADEQGRSASNLVAFIVESKISELKSHRL
jgi:predicted DNA-binding protein